MVPVETSTAKFANLSIGAVRLRLRNRPCFPRPIPPPHDILVRNAGRSERYMALDGRGNFTRTHNWSAS